MEKKEKKKKKKRKKEKSANKKDGVHSVHNCQNLIDAVQGSFSRIAFLVRYHACALRKDRQYSVVFYFRTNTVYTIMYHVIDDVIEGRPSYSLKIEIDY